MKIKTGTQVAFTLTFLLSMTAAMCIAAQAPDVLKSGTYTAKVKAITCGGCGPLIVKTMEAMKEIDTVSVDSKNKTVQFAVKTGVALNRVEMQKALDAAAKKMGMGADYTLLDLKPVK